GDVAAPGHAAVGDDVHVPAAGLVQVVAARGRDVRDRGGHRDGDAEHLAGRVRGATAEADEDARGAGAHQVLRRLVRRAPTDDDGDVELVDELLEVQRLRTTRHVLGRDRGAADDEDVGARVDDRLV